MRQRASVQEHPSAKGGPWAGANLGESVQEFARAKCSGSGSKRELKGGRSNK